VSNNNDWYSNGASKIIYDGVVLSLSEWQAETGQDSLAIDGYPVFVGSGDFNLQSISPCLNAGVDVGITTDIQGRPIIGNPDMGAYESVFSPSGGGVLNPALTGWPRRQ
jgi:hypothetical protein